MRKHLWMALVLILLFAFPVTADTIDYTITGMYGTLTFTLPVNPATSSYTFSDTLNQGFVIWGVPTSNGIEAIRFYTASLGGGLNAVSVGGTYDLYGPQLYTGSESNPTLLTGTFTLNQGSSTGPTVTLQAVPEPTTILLLGTGLIGIGRRLRKKS